MANLAGHLLFWSGVQSLSLVLRLGNPCLVFPSPGSIPFCNHWDDSLSWPRLPVQQLRLAGWFLTGLCFPFPNLRDGMKTCFRLQFHRSFMSFLFPLPVPSTSASPWGLPDTSGVGGLGLLPPPWLELGSASSVLARCLALVWRCLLLSRLRIGLVRAQVRRQVG